jgi:hypothetical protein
MYPENRVSSVYSARPSRPMPTDYAAPRRPPITARLPLDLVARLDAQAKRLRTTRTALLRAFAARGVEELERTAAA